MLLFDQTMRQKETGNEGLQGLRGKVAVLGVGVEGGG